TKWILCPESRMHGNVPVRFGRGRLDSLGNKGLAAYLIAKVRYRDLLLPPVRVRLPAFARSRTASMRLSRSAAGRSAAFGLTDGPKGLATDQAVARLLTAVRRKSGRKAVPHLAGILRLGQRRKLRVQGGDALSRALRLCHVRALLAAPLADKLSGAA